jgi:hypothetical protein
VGVVGEPHVVETCLLDPPGIPELGPIGQGVTDVRVLLVAIGTPEKQALAVDPEPFAVDLDPSDPNLQRLPVNHHPVGDQLAIKVV